MIALLKITLEQTEPQVCGSTEGKMFVEPTNPLGVLYSTQAHNLIRHVASHLDRRSRSAYSRL